MSFSDFQLHPKLIERTAEQGYTSPTPIQLQTIPLALEGRDIIGLAQTGTGKTAAFALPIIHHLVSESERRHRPKALVLTPTRELADQVNEVFRTFASGSGLRSNTFYGGTGYGAQLQALSGGVDIVVACPGRLVDLMDRRAIDLSAVRYLVLDEADQMFDMGFFPTIRKIIGRLPQPRQNLMFSATMPGHIRELATEFLRNPEVVQIARIAPTETVAQHLYPLSGSEMKAPLLLAILKNVKQTESVLVFTRTKHRAKKLGTLISDAGFRCTSLQGNLAQNKRALAMSGFRSGKYQVMVATDIAARGLDISQVAHVVNFDIPDTLDAYTHRIGRTGRAERTGDAYTFITSEDRELLRSFERDLGLHLERRLFEGFDYNTDTTQLLAEFAPRSLSQRSSRGGSNDRRPTRSGPSRSGQGRPGQSRDRRGYDRGNTRAQVGRGREARGQGEGLRGGHAEGQSERSSQGPRAENSRSVASERTPRFRPEGGRRAYSARGAQRSDA